MKTLRKQLLTAVFLITTASATAQPMSYYAIRDNARFLTDRMAYTLGIATSLLDDLYCINYDYICGVNDYLDDVALGYRYDDYMAVMAARDAALRSLLTYEQWERLVSLDYFYRPIVFRSNRWYFSIYRHDPHVGHFYFAAPPRYHGYRGGHFFGGMDPRGGHAPGHEAGYAHRGYRFDRPGGNHQNANRPAGERGGNARGSNDKGYSPNSNRGTTTGSRGDANSRSDNNRSNGNRQSGNAPASSNASASNNSHTSASSSRNNSRDGGRTSARSSRNQASRNSRGTNASRSSSSAGRSNTVSRPASGNSRSSAARSSSSAQRGGGRR